jgi:glycosyltransferase involved in cell wall biosynthesis
MARHSDERTLLVLTQVYMPDPTSVGQHIADAAAELAGRGYRVVVLTSNRGYDDPSVRYKRREAIQGVTVRRLPLSSFGKRSFALRLVGGVLFVSQAAVRGLLVRRVDAILVSTSPPMCPLAAVIISTVRRVPILYWAMDINPDQAVAVKIVSESSLAARGFNWMNRLILRRARRVVALDRFMADRLFAKYPAADKTAILPPWPHEGELAVVEREGNPFRSEHRLDGKFVLMYSGNHSPSNPLDTLLEAALRLQDVPELMFVFVGGGIGKKQVEGIIREHKPTNILSLPYQPMSDLKYSLSAADVHVVSLGDGLEGILHPCKVYGAMAVARPVLYFGPAPSHVSEILGAFDIGWRVRHGDVAGAVETIRRIHATDRDELQRMGDRARLAMEQRFSKSRLCGQFCDVVESVLVGCERGRAQVANCCEKPE